MLLVGRAVGARLHRPPIASPTSTRINQADKRHEDGGTAPKGKSGTARRSPPSQVGPAPREGGNLFNAFRRCGEFLSSRFRGVAARAGRRFGNTHSRRRAACPGKLPVARQSRRDPVLSNAGASRPRRQDFRCDERVAFRSPAFRWHAVTSDLIEVQAAARLLPSRCQGPIPCTISQRQFGYRARSPPRAVDAAR